jgi:hypothetical protein
MSAQNSSDGRRKSEGEADARAARLKAALQANIARRKGQARARAALQAEGSEGQEDPEHD